MAKIIKKVGLEESFAGIHFSFDTNLENFKRKRALHHFSILDDGSKGFFERMLEVKKIKDLIFVTKAESKGR